MSRPHGESGGVRGPGPDEARGRPEIWDHAVGHEDSNRVIGIPGNNPVRLRGGRDLAASGGGAHAVPAGRVFPPGGVIPRRALLERRATRARGAAAGRGGAESVGAPGGPVPGAGAGRGGCPGADRVGGRRGRAGLPAPHEPDLSLSTGRADGGQRGPLRSLLPVPVPGERGRFVAGAPGSAPRILAQTQRFMARDVCSETQHRVR